MIDFFGFDFVGILILLCILIYLLFDLGGELELGCPFSKTISLQNFDLVLLNSSKVYYCSHPFQGNKVNLIFIVI
jgi:hypothetical protein